MFERTWARGLISVVSVVWYISAGVGGFVFLLFCTRWRAVVGVGYLEHCNELLPWIDKFLESLEACYL